MSLPHDFDDDEEFPLLTDVIEQGNLKPEPIPSHTPTADNKTTPARIPGTDTTREPTSYNSYITSRLKNSDLPISDKKLEQLVDEIIEHHTRQMRCELLTLINPPE